MNEIITPRTRSVLTKSNSFKTVIGQSSPKGIKSGRRSDEQDKKKKHPKVERAVEPMEVDDDHHSRSSLAPSVPASRRGAAAKAL
jgi:hypothetical protein